MSSYPWSGEMSQLLYKIERETESSICKLKKSLKRCGLQFDRKFRKYFLRAADNRLSETFDRFEIDSIETAADDNSMHRSGRSVSHSYEHKNGRLIKNGYRYGHNRSRSQSRSRSRNCTRSRSRIRERSQSHYTSHRLHDRHTSVKDRLGTPVKKQKPSIKQRLTSPPSDHHGELSQTEESSNMQSESEQTNVNKQIVQIDVGALDDILTNICIPSKMAEFQDLIFCCANCPDDDDSLNSTSRQIEDVYAHWLSGHTDIPHVKPFAFTVIDANSACFYCENIGTLKQLMRHQKASHRNRAVAIVNPSDRKECAFCEHSGGNWTDHFGQSHKMFLENEGDFNPISLQMTLNKLLAIDIHQKRQCGRCDRIFETQHELECHGSLDHANEEIISNICSDPPKIHLICDVCRKSIDPNAYLSHLNEHKYDFKCIKCHFSTGDLVDLTFHVQQFHEIDALSDHCLAFAERLKLHFFRTKCHFGNGLILSKHNLLNTDFDDFGEFRQMIETTIDVVVKKFDWLMQSQQENGGHNGNDEGGEDDDDANSITTTECLMSTLASSTARRHKPTDDALVQRPPIPSIYYREFKQQQRLVKNICIHGIPRRENENLWEIVRRVFNKLDADISTREIAVVHRVSKANPLTIVKFTKVSVKQHVMICRRIRDVQTTEVMDILPGVMPSKIHIFSHLTDFFEELRRLAKLGIQEQRLYSYCLTKYGFVVRRSKNAPEKIIFSKSELQAFIGRGQ